jgi:hypothetical protein
MSKLDEAFADPMPIEDPIAHVRNAVQINGADLRIELERLPADLAYYGFQYAGAARRVLAGKMHLEEVSAVVYLDVRETLEDLSTKGRVTESTIDATVLKDERVREARAEMVEAEFEREQLRAVCDALRAKRENLTSLVLLARAELAGSHGFRDPTAQEK